jgi:hypothetical protein
MLIFLLYLSIFFLFSCGVWCLFLYFLFYQGIGNLRRKRHLDDALFEFFSKEVPLLYDLRRVLFLFWFLDVSLFLILFLKAIKSLKRDFSKLCRESNIPSQVGFVGTWFSVLFIFMSLGFLCHFCNLFPE